MPDFFDIYKKRFQVSETKIVEPPQKEIGIIVVIPCSNEPDIISTLNSLNQCDKPDCAAEVIVVINASENAAKQIFEQNKKTVKEILDWKNKTDPNFNLFIIEENNLPPKQAGVGLARKIGMDEAASRFAQIENKRGIIACFDADCTCDKGYFKALEKHFNQNKSGACSIYYEHPTSGNVFPQEIYDAIIKYEIHLRYYKQALAFTGFPYAFHTVGSSMAATAETYCKAGGMNKRKAGEDFYFIQKLMPLTAYSELNSTRIIPSPRKSVRVPFGTGKAMIDIAEKGDFKTYNFQCFQDLKIFFSEIKSAYPFDEIDLEVVYNNFPESFQVFLKKAKFTDNLNRCLSNATTKEIFLKNFFQYFDAFHILKFIHFCTGFFYPKVDLIQAGKCLHNITATSELQLLEKLRKIDKAR